MKFLNLLCIIELTQGEFKNNMVTVYPHPTKGTHLIKYIKEKNLDSHGHPPEKTILVFIIDQNRKKIVSWG